jgi:iron complex transport system substrate-binding protein
MKKSILLVLIFIFLFGTACSTQPAQGGNANAAQASGGEFTVKDALDREVKFTSPPQRIVIAGKAVFMLSDAIYAFPDMGNRIVAIADRSQSAKDFLPLIDPKFAEKKTLESEAGAEQIAPLKPDLVILKSFTREKLGKPIEALGIPVIYLDLETPEQYERDVKILGAVLQNPGRADVLVNEYQRLANVTSETSKKITDDKKPKVLLLYYNEKDGATSLNIPPTGYIQTTLVKIAGGNPVWADANKGSGWLKVNFEQIAAWDADQIYIITYSTDLNKAMGVIKADPQWQALRAMKDGKVYGFPTDFYSYDQPDTRWYMGLSWLAAKVNPDLYPGFSMQDTIIKFYKLMYNLDEAAVKGKIIPEMKGDWK